jgi:hypothetical protein
MAAGAGRPGTVNPNVDPDVQAATSGEVTTLDGMFAGEATVVDEVVETPMRGDEPPGGWWIIRPNTNIEHMTVGTIDNSYVFEQGRRYRVPAEVMSILAHRDYLLEIPTRYRP